MEGYTGFQGEKKKIGSTLMVVLIIHVVLAGGVAWFASTQVGQEWLKVHKINIVNLKEKTPPPPPEKPAEPELEPPPPEEVAELPPQPAEPTPPTPAAPPAAAPVKLPGFGDPFAGGKGKKFAGYADLVTSEIQRLYKQPPELPDALRLVVLCQLLIDSDGQVLSFKLLNSSGNSLFDRSALQALSQLKKLRPPPQEMPSRVLVVKFFPPS